MASVALSAASALVDPAKCTVLVDPILSGQ